MLININGSYIRRFWYHFILDVLILQNLFLGSRFFFTASIMISVIVRTPVHLSQMTVRCLLLKVKQLQIVTVWWRFLLPKTSWLMLSFLASHPCFTGSSCFQHVHKFVKNPVVFEKNESYQAHIVKKSV